MAAVSDVTPLARKFLRLHLCSGIGPIRTQALLRELGGIDAVLGAPAGTLGRVRGIGATIAENLARSRDGSPVEAEIERAARTGVRILCMDDPDYPAALRAINDPPVCIYLRGQLQREDAVALAVVGSRHCTRYGAEQAERFGALLAQTGLTVVSGMARGIDSAAHHGALTAGGRTIAVLGCGLNHLYPPESTDLAARIFENGALISELPMDVAPDAKNFPPRNRIIIGLSLGALVVEAAMRSGALITARLAIEYNRECFALPGQIDRPHSAGCHELIKTGGARLVTELADILDELGEVGAVLRRSEPGSNGDSPSESTDSPALFSKLDDVESRLHEALAEEPCNLDALCERTALTPARVAAALTGMQLKGLVRQVGGDLYERRAK